MNDGTKICILDIKERNANENGIIRKIESDIDAFRIIYQCYLIICCYFHCWSIFHALNMIFCIFWKYVKWFLMYDMNIIYELKLCRIVVIKDILLWAYNQKILYYKHNLKLLVIIQDVLNICTIIHKRFIVESIQWFEVTICKFVTCDKMKIKVSCYFFQKQVSFSIQSTMFMLKVNVTGRVAKEITGNIIRL